MVLSAADGVEVMERSDLGRANPRRFGFYKLSCSNHQGASMLASVSVGTMDTRKTIASRRSLAESISKVDSPHHNRIL
jgi:hypothetical protein